MKDSFVMTIQAEDPRHGTLEVQHMVDIGQLNSYNGPLGRIILHNPNGADSQFVMPVSDFIIALAQFIQAFAGKETVQ